MQREKFLRYSIFLSLLFLVLFAIIYPDNREIERFIIVIIIILQVINILLHRKDN